jgi:hypothetical protein
MLKKLDHAFPIDPIVEQVKALPYFERYIQLNETTEGRLFNGPYQTKPEFVGTPLGNVLEALGNVGEARLLKLKPEESYMAHSDPDDRLHMSIITNEYCRIIDLEENQMYYLPVDGTVWLMDTGPIHVASNFGAHERIHLNIRVLLPDVKDGWVRFTVEGGDYDWRHIIQISITRWMNRALKEGRMTGIRKLGDREMLVNPKDQAAMDELIRVGEQAGFTIKTSTV